ncbi:MAG TPA: Gfo/Idh/MocA family oxidoreductase [Acidimicrobiales bacterium]|nr:Gfo/Idh/MocA family oxidoreductase [Acidimicrobiales bacterium]
MIGVVVVGAGHWGPNLIRNFHNPPASRVVRVVDQSERRLAQVAERYPDVAIGTRLDDALEDDDVSAVVVATPTSTHHVIVRQALGAGRHVLVEKPITTTSAEGLELDALARQRGVVLMVGHVFVYNGGVRKVREYIEQDVLGTIFYISMVRTNLGPIRVDVNAAWDLASHDISIANYWLTAEPIAASAVGGSWINPGVEDAVFATLRYPRGVLVNLHSSWLNPRKSRDITVVGDRSMLTLDDMNLNEPIRIYDKGVTDETFTPAFIDTFASFRAGLREGSITIPRVGLGEPLRAECDHFLDCIASGSAPMTGAPEAISVVRVLEAIERSARNGGREEPVGSQV